MTFKISELQISGLIAKVKKLPRAGHFCRRHRRVGNAEPVRQDFKSHASPVSRPARRATPDGPPIWKSAIRQVWKPALRLRALFSMVNPLTSLAQVVCLAGIV